eukprot:UN19537
MNLNAALTRFNEEEIAQFKETFSEYDVDGCGYIGKDELVKIMKT